jgi:hypothetical protein
MMFLSVASVDRDVLFAVVQVERAALVDFIGHERGRQFAAIAGQNQLP